jgi:predicted nuclease with TOPRIM domain
MRVLRSSQNPDKAKFAELGFWEVRIRTILRSSVVKVRHTQTYANMPLGKEPLMRKQLQDRLGILKKEFETGEAELERVEKHRAHLRETLLRIGGAIQVLEELLAEGQPAEKREATGPTEIGSEPTESRQGSVRSQDADQATQ